MACVWRAKRQTVIDMAEVIELTYSRPTKDSWGGVLTVVTANEQFPLIKLSAMFRSESLEEIYDRMRVMREAGTQLTTEREPRSVAREDRLEIAIAELTKAVSSLTEAINVASKEVQGVEDKSTTND